MFVRLRLKVFRNCSFGLGTMSTGIPRALGIAFIAIGIVHAVLSLFIIFVFGGKAPINPDTAREFLPVLGYLGPAAFPLAFATSVLGIIAGFGLMGLRPWARRVAIIISPVQLFIVPFGTALSVLTFWFLLRGANSSKLDSSFKTPPR